MSEDAIRRSMRRRQFANTFVILLFALGIVALSAFLLERLHKVHGEQPVIPLPPEVEAVLPPRPSPAASIAAPAPASTVAPPAALALRLTAEKPRPVAPVPPEAKPVKPPRTPPPPSLPPDPAMPTVKLAPDAPAESAAFDNPSAGAAKRMLVSIKCVEQLNYEGARNGRRYFSGLCENGQRREVSCTGAGCKIEYARPPSHVE